MNTQVKRESLFLTRDDLIEHIRMGRSISIRRLRQILFVCGEN